jgi:CHAD domain-containing protein
VRDLDVTMALLPPALRAEARARRSAAQARLAALLGALPPLRLPRAAARRQPPLPLLAREALSRLDRKALRRGARTDWSDAEARHLLRSRLRRLRYASEFLQDAFPQRDPERLIASLKALQDLLGELNDIEVARRLARELSHPSRAASVRERLLRARLPAAWRRYAEAPRFWL